MHGWYSPQGLFELYQRDTVIADERLEESGYEYLQNKNGLSLRYYQINAKYSTNGFKIHPAIKVKIATNQKYF